MLRKYNISNVVVFFLAECFPITTINEFKLLYTQGSEPLKVETPFYSAQGIMQKGANFPLTQSGARSSQNIYNMFIVDETKRKFETGS